MKKKQKQIAAAAALLLIVTVSSCGSFRGTTHMAIAGNTVDTMQYEPVVVQSAPDMMEPARIEPIVVVQDSEPDPATVYLYNSGNTALDIYIGKDKEHLAKRRINSKGWLIDRQYGPAPVVRLITPRVGAASKTIITRPNPGRTYEIFRRVEPDRFDMRPTNQIPGTLRR